MKTRWSDIYTKSLTIYQTFKEREDEGNRILTSLFKHYNFEGKIVLEVGCGVGKYAELIAPMCKKYFSMDISETLTTIAKQRCKELDNVEYFVGSIECLPIATNSVDTIFASWVLVGVIGYLANSEISRVLKSKGDCLAIENYCTGEFMSIRGEFNQEPEKWSHPLTEYGFQTVEIINTNFFFHNIDEAKQVLGFLFGETPYLESFSNSRVEHNVVFLRKKIG